MTQDEMAAHPSVAANQDRPAPFAWLQWKGTRACMDVHCLCGAHLHFDGDFAYHVRCPHCRRIYECDGHITLRPLDFDPGNVKDIRASADDFDDDDEEEEP
jgi:hypothetical protein